MKVFLSWSGHRSRALASALREWLPDVINFVEPWMSNEDIPKGSHWPQALGNELETSDVGVLCVTPENQREPWLLFEAGALAKKFGEGPRVCVYLLDLRPQELKPGPLTLYQHTVASESDTQRLLTALNEACGDLQLPQDRLRRAFARCWPDLEKTILHLRQEGVPKASGETKSDRELMEEILLDVRDLLRSRSSSPDRRDRHHPLVMRFISAVAKRRSSLAALLEGAHHIESMGDRVIIWISDGDNLLGAALNREANQEILEDATKEIFGEECRYLAHHLPS